MRACGCMCYTIFYSLRRRGADWHYCVKCCKKWSSQIVIYGLSSKMILYSLSDWNRITCCEKLLMKGDVTNKASFPQYYRLFWTLIRNIFHKMMQGVATDDCWWYLCLHFASIFILHWFPGLVCMITSVSSTSQVYRTLEHIQWQRPEIESISPPTVRGNAQSKFQLVMETSEINFNPMDSFKLHI